MAVYLRFRQAVRRRLRAKNDCRQRCDRQAEKAVSSARPPHNLRLSSFFYLFFYSNSVRLAIRKLTYAPTIKRPQPMIDVNKEFLVSPGMLHLEASLDREVQ